MGVDATQDNLPQVKHVTYVYCSTVLRTHACPTSETKHQRLLRVQLILSYIQQIGTTVIC